MDSSTRSLLAVLWVELFIATISFPAQIVVWAASFIEFNASVLHIVYDFQSDYNFLTAEYVSICTLMQLLHIGLCPFKRIGI